MALVVICGFPASGKTTFSTLLATNIRESGRDVVVVDDDGRTSVDGSESHGRSPAEKYATSADEKVIRSRARAAAERALDGRRVVILDAPNYVKGYRYELWCAARTHGVAHCVVHVRAEADTCVARDFGRDSGDSYGEALVRALIARFEAPNAKNRWDFPLHLVDAESAESTEKLHSRAREVADAVLDGGPKSSNGKTQTRVIPRATRPGVRPDADALGTLDRMTRGAESELISAIRGGSGVGSRHKPTGATRTIFLSRVPRAGELRAMRRALLNVARMDPPTDLSDAAVLDGYADYVNQQLQSGAGGS